MLGNKLLKIVTVLVFCSALIVGCASSDEPTEEPVREAKVLTFTDMSVKTSSRTGFFGGRYASFEITGSVTNKTENPINKDNIPSVTWPEGNKVKANITQEKLLTNETCDVTWKKELTVDGSAIPEVTFSGSVEFVGLDECQEELNTQLQAIADDFASQDSAKEEEQKAQEQAKAEEAQKKEDAKKSLTQCKGKSALEAYEAAKATEYVPSFVDSYDVDVTGDIEKATADSELGKALVSEVVIQEAGWFSDATVTFTLDYTDPAAKKERDEKAAADKAKKEADKEIPSCKGKTADEALEVASRSSYSPRFEDSYGVNVTADVEDSSNGSDVHSAKVTKVETSEAGWFWSATVTFTLDYTDPEAKAERDAEEERKAAAEQLEKDIEECEGKSVAHAYKLVKDSEFDYTFRLQTDSGIGDDITDEVKDKLYKGARKRTKVTHVSIRGNKVTFNIERHLAMTPEDNEDLRAILQVPDEFDENISVFADKYYGKNIEFDGCFADAFVSREAKYPANKLYDVLIQAMGYDPNSAIGPNFQMKDVRISSFNWTGDEPSTIKTGQNVHIVARLGAFNEKSSLYQLTPIETSLR